MSVQSMCISYSHITSILHLTTDFKEEGFKETGKIQTLDMARL